MSPAQRIADGLDMELVLDSVRKALLIPRGRKYGDPEYRVELGFGDDYHDYQYVKINYHGCSGEGLDGVSSISMSFVTGVSYES